MRKSLTQKKKKNEKPHCVSSTSYSCSSDFYGYTPSFNTVCFVLHQPQNESKAVSFFLSFFFFFVCLYVRVCVCLFVCFFYLLPSCFFHLFALHSARIFSRTAYLFLFPFSSQYHH